MSTLNLENIKHPDSASNNISVDSSGNTIANGKLGVGTNAPVKGVEVQSSSSENDRTLRLAYDGTYYADIAQLGAGGVAYRAFGGLQHIFETGGTERMRIDSAGRVTMPYQPFMSGGRSAGNVSQGVCIMNDLDSNRGNHYSTSTGLFTCPVSGLYAIQFSVMTNQSFSNNEDMFSIAINGSNVRNHYQSTNGQQHQRADGFLLWYASANDTISFVARGPLIYGGSKTHTYGNICLVN